MMNPPLDILDAMLEAKKKLTPLMISQNIITRACEVAWQECFDQFQAIDDNFLAPRDDKQERRLSAFVALADTLEELAPALKSLVPENIRALETIERCAKQMEGGTDAPAQLLHVTAELAETLSLCVDKLNSMRTGAESLLQIPQIESQMRVFLDALDATIALGNRHWFAENDLVNALSPEV